ncbi:MAG: SIMPL domain-containing protein [Clostridiales bacterium]|nr:SIMPL domain-containing protein [Clostridiales bacterium]
MPRTITVRGTGKIFAKPDLISVSMTVEAKDPDYAAAMVKADRDAEAISNAVRDAGIERDALRMADFNVRADYESVHDERGNWKNVFAGYAVTRTYQLRFPLDAAVLSALLGNIGASEASPQLSVSFILSDPEKAKKDALEAAVRDAREKAELLAHASGCTLGALLSIEYSVAHRDTVSATTFCADNGAMPMMAKAAFRMESAPQDVEIMDNAVFTWEIA